MLLKQRNVLHLLFILAQALVLRVIVAWPALSGEQPFVIGDDVDYYRLAISLLERGRLEEAGEPTAYRLPFFPLLLAGIYALLGTDPYAAMPVLIGLSTLSCLLTYLLARRAFGAHVALLASLITSLDPALILYTCVLLSETLTVFLLLLLLLLLDKLRQTQHWQLAVGSGLLLGCITLTRGNFILLIPTVLCWLAFSQSAERRSQLRNLVLIAVVSGLIWGIWVVRNYYHFRTFIPLNTQSGSAYRGIYNDYSASQSSIAGFGVWIDIPPPPEAADELQQNQLLHELAMDWVRRHPAQALQIALMQAVHFWRPSFEGPFYLLIPGAIAGMVLAWRRFQPAVGLWLLLQVLLTLTAINTLGLPRFRLPLHPVLAIFTALMLTTAWDAMRLGLIGGGNLEQSSTLAD